ncbi:MAG: hypothetical protein JRJ60_12070 [Deltaproteobacteria bacterium]|nr:hypothetical protein [Deltaproteobacteria bacterium]
MSSLTSIGFHPNTFGGREYAVRESWVPDGDYDNDDDHQHDYDYDNDNDNEHRFAEYAGDRRTSEVDGQELMYD